MTTVRACSSYVCTIIYIHVSVNSGCVCSAVSVPNAVQYVYAIAVSVSVHIRTHASCVRSCTFAECTICIGWYRYAIWHFGVLIVLVL